MAMQIRQEINIETIANNTSYGIVQLDTTKYVNPTYYFEVQTPDSAAGTDTFTLRRKGTTTDDATISYTSGQSGRKRVSFTPPTGQTEYIKFQSVVTGRTLKLARIIVIDNPTTLISSQTQIEIGMWKSGLTSTTSTKVVPDTTLTKYWKYTAANWNGTTTFYAEVTYLMASSKSSGTFVLQEDNGSFASWTDKVTIVNAGIASVATRVRSASFTPTDGRNYRIAYLVASSKSAATIYNAKIIVDQAGTTGVADSYGTGNDSTAVNLDNTSGNKISGQSFTGDGGALDSAQFLLAFVSGSGGNIRAKVYAESHATAYGTDSVGSGTELATSSDVNTSSLSGTPALVTFTFTGTNRITLTNGTNYVVAVENLNSSAVASISFYRDATSPTHAGNNANILAGSSTWASNSARDSIFYVYTIVSSGGITLLEPQYLLLNTADSGSTGLQSFNQLWDSTEWSGLTNVYKHAMDSDNASNSAKLRDTTASSDVTNSTVTGANQQISSAMTMPTTGDTMDTWILNTTGVVGASRILVATSVTVSTDLNITVSDTITISESVDVLRAGARDINTSDTITVTESIGQLLESNINKSDIITITENVGRELNSSINKSDTITITENIGILNEQNVNKSDTITITENLGLLIPTLFLNVSDTITITESIGMSIAVDPLSVSVSDTITITESVGRLLESYVNKSDTITITESVGNLLESNINKSDTITITESVTPLIPTLLVNVSDSLSISESIKPELTSFINRSDTITITENVQLLEIVSISVSDTITITESIGRLATSFINKSDTITITESVNADVPLTVNVSDTITITDSDSLLIPTLNSSVSDSISVSESINVVINNPGVPQASVSDTVTITESISVVITELNISVSDTINVTDSINVLPPILTINKSDTITVTENVSLLETGGGGGGTANNLTLLGVG